MSVKLPDFEQWIDAMAPVLKLSISPELRPGVKNNLKTAAKMAALLDKVEMKDAADAAPIYRV